MFRAVFYSKNGLKRVDVQTHKEAKSIGLYSDAFGVAITMRPKSDGPSGYSYYLTDKIIRGVGKTEFMSMFK